MSEPRSTASTAARTLVPLAVTAVTDRTPSTASAVVTTSPPAATATPQSSATPPPFVETSRATIDCSVDRAAVGTTLQQPLTALATDGGSAVEDGDGPFPDPAFASSRTPASTAAAAPTPTPIVARCPWRRPGWPGAGAGSIGAPPAMPPAPPAFTVGTSDGWRQARSRGGIHPFDAASSLSSSGPPVARSSSLAPSGSGPPPKGCGPVGVTGSEVTEALPSGDVALGADDVAPRGGRRPLP